MRSRPALLAVGLVLTAAAPAQAADSRVIAAGVTVRGIDVGNLTVDQAAEQLAGALTTHLSRDVIARVGAGQQRLTAKQAKLKLDWVLTAKRAYNAGRTQTPVDVAPAISHSKRAVAAWADAVRRRTMRKPKDAGVRITLRHIFRTHSSPGRAIDATALATAVDTALDDSRAARTVRAPLSVRVAPKVTAATLARRYSSIITIDRAHFTLRLFKGLKLRKRYGIAVGMAGLDTPSGQYAIQDKQINPAWHVPKSAWAGSLAGQTIPGGAPNNPLKARWMGLANGVGIHGTAEEWSIGSRASHGCIRMRVRDVVDLFRRVSVGTPVLVR